jgi:hypothetical protein
MHKVKSRQLPETYGSLEAAGHRLRDIRSKELRDQRSRNVEGRNGGLEEP